MDFVPDKHLGKTVTVTGMARDAMAGAIVMLDDGTPIYVVGLSGWDEDVVDARVEIRGLLVQLPSRIPKPPPNGEVSHGVGSRFGMEKATWDRVD
jgi:hypothetical protein